jgi:di/tricarboxylate transporter
MSGSEPPQSSKRVWRNLLRSLARDPFFLALLALLVLLTAVAPEKAASYPALVDWPTLCALAGLLMLTKGVESSGVLYRVGQWLIAHLASERAAALALVLASAGLSTVLTNDVALFVVLPLTLTLCRLAQLKPARLIVFEALAVNAGSALTPIGNPQNLFLWHLSQRSFAEFTWHMFPLVAVLMGLLLVLTALSFPARPIDLHPDLRPHVLDKPLLALSIGLYLPFLVLTDLHLAPWALAGVAALLLLMRPRVLAYIDWGLLLVFVLMFIDLRLIAALAPVREALGGLGLAQAGHLYLAGIGASQIVSNVPAAILLAEYSQDWRVLAYAVNVGGFGLLIGSLANLIALRMGRDRDAWRLFHRYSVPALLVAALVGWLLLWIG